MEQKFYASLDISVLESMNECKWVYDGFDASWEGSCGVKWQFTEGTPSDNGCNFCMRCGKKLEE